MTDSVKSTGDKEREHIISQGRDSSVSVNVGFVSKPNDGRSLSVGASSGSAASSQQVYGLSYKPSPFAGQVNGKPISKTSLGKYLSNTGPEDMKGLKPQNQTETKPTPRRAPRGNAKALVQSKLRSTTVVADRPCQHHSFLTDLTDVRQMEQGLLQLLDDFHSGKLQAFGKDCTFEKMENVREQQERLARLHFDLNAQQEMQGPKSDEGRRMAKENLDKLTNNLQRLSQSIEELQSTSHCLHTDV
ncbi:uncharacterized protein LOC143251188 isoform X1 [Tachypleus tridentatus]|uniref:uncharacterized protein LOC143251188 isoform X1 n=1 Tax=Tachypleus tridentatus TaxID=6853 RepID=UPI003FD35D6E